MQIIDKIKLKLLNSSNSYNFYKNNYLAQNIQLKLLNEELEDKNSEINRVNYRIDKMLSFDLLFKENLTMFNTHIKEIFDNQRDFASNLNEYYEKLSYRSNEVNESLIKFETMLSKSNRGMDEKSDVILDFIKNENIRINNHVEMLFNHHVKEFNKFNKNIKNSMDFIENNYKNCRKYFFKGNESLLEPYLDTDFMFNFCYFNNIELLSYSPKENLILLKNKDGIVIGTNNHLWTIMEIYGLNEYMIPILFYFDDFVVFDIGMNRAYASLSFANMQNCSSVFGFEIDEFVYSKAIDNISLNPNLANKITTYNFGLSDEDGIVELYCYEGFDGLNTMMYDFLEANPSLNLYKDKLDVKKVHVKKASEVILDIISKNNITSNIVLKIDTEGAEYKIVYDLIKIRFN